MADYPDWVLQHKKKGTYINYQNGKYYLYAAHSERVPGTKKVRRVSDGYLGHITKEEGLIPPRDKVSGDVLVFEFGLSATIFFFSDKIFSALHRDFKGNADFMICAAVLTVIYGYCTTQSLSHSFLSVLFPCVSMERMPTQKQALAIERTVLMIKDTLAKHLGDDLHLIMQTFPFIHKVKVNQRFYLEKLPDTVADLKQKHQIIWED